MSYTSEKILLPLQRRQRAHDERAHWDIFCLPQLDKLKHMALHFFKYAGRLASASGDAHETRRNLVDVLIIGLSAANAINLSLGTRLKTSVRATSLGDLSRLLGDKVDVLELPVFAALELSRAGGRMAKALESLDHIERGDPRGVLETSISELVELALSCLGALEVDIRAAVENRYSEVEAASIFQGE